MTQKLISNATKWSVLAEITAKIAAPIVNIVLARILAPEAYGVVASITIITSFADIFTDAGFQKYVIQHEYNSDYELDLDSNVAFTTNLLMSLIIYLLIFLFRNQLAVGVGNPDAANGLAVAALAVLCTSFSSVVIARFRRDLNFRPLFFVRLGSSFIPLAITVPLAFFLRTYWALIIGTVAQQVFIALFVCIISRYKPKIYFNIAIFSRMLKFSAWNLCETLSIWFAGQANIFIVARELNSYYLGLYRTGMTTINSYMALFTSAITPVLFSSLSRAQGDRNEYILIFNRFQRILSIFVVPMGVGIFIYRELAVRVLLGSAWLEVTQFMGLWALVSSITITFSNMASEVYRSMGKPKVSFYIQMVYLLIYIPVIYIFAKRGFNALSIVSCLIRLVPVVMDLIVLDCLFKIRIHQILRNIGYVLFATVCMSIFALIMRGQTSSIIGQFLTIGLCVFIYIIILMFNEDYRQIFLSIIKRKEEE